jgi:hypothetical protein
MHTRQRDLKRVDTAVVAFEGCDSTGKEWDPHTLDSEHQPRGEKNGDACQPDSRSDDSKQRNLPLADDDRSIR